MKTVSKEVKFDVKFGMGTKITITGCKTLSTNGDCGSECMGQK